jgi:hypothetical protein
MAHLYPERRPLPYSRELRRLEMCEPERRQVSVLTRKRREAGYNHGELRYQQRQRRFHEYQVCVTSVRWQIAGFEHIARDDEAEKKTDSVT